MSEAPAPVGDPPVEAPPLEAAAPPVVPPETPAPEAPAPSPLGVQPAGDTSTAPVEPPLLTAESYTFTLPDGISLDEGSMTTLKETLAKSNVPPEVGQSLIDLHVAGLSKSAEAFATAQAAEWTKTTDEWKSAISADPDLGGSKMPEVQAAVGRALDQYGTPETRLAFDLTGAGWNPAIIKFVHNMAKALSEGAPHPAAGPPSNRNRAPADVLYGDKSN